MNWPKPSSSGAWLLMLLFLVTVVNFLDRQVLSIVQEDVKRDLALSDSQLGLLALAFGLTHAFCALPIGRLADRVPRKSVLVACLAVWSSFTILGAAVTNFGQLLAVRMGVGAGEAGVTPTTYSLISDRFPLKRRASAMAISGAGIPVGLMLSLLLGGLIAEAFGWRLTFILFGLPGLLLAVVFMTTVKAPRRGEADGVTTVRTSGLLDSFKYLLTSPSFALIIAGAMFKSIVSYGVLQWLPSYYIREFDLTPGEVGVSFGPILGIAGLIAMLSAAFLADRLSQRDIRWYAWIIAMSLVIATPLLWASLLTQNYILSLVLFAMSTMFGSSLLAITNALVQSTSPVQMRGMASALKSFALSFIGYGIGGALIGVLSDVFSGEGAADGLRTALMIATAMQLVAALLFWALSPRLGRDIDRAKSFSSDGHQGAKEAVT